MGGKGGSRSRRRSSPPRPSRGTGRRRRGHTWVSGPRRGARGRRVTGEGRRQEPCFWGEKGGDRCRRHTQNPKVWTPPRGLKRVRRSCLCPTGPLAVVLLTCSLLGPGWFALKQNVLCPKAHPGSTEVSSTRQVLRRLQRGHWLSKVHVAARAELWHGCPGQQRALVQPRTDAYNLHFSD